MKWYFISICLHLCLFTGSLDRVIAPWLSPGIFAGSYLCWGSIPFNRWIRYKLSCVVLARAMFSDSQVNSATVGCFFDFHEIGELSLNKKILLYYVDHSDQTPNLRRCKLRSLTHHFSGNTVRNGMYLLNTLGYVLLLPNAIDVALIDTVIIYLSNTNSFICTQFQVLLFNTNNSIKQSFVCTQLNC